MIFFQITLPFQSLLETDGMDDSRHSPLGNMRRKMRPTLTPRQSERALLSGDSTSSSERNSVGRLSGIARWFRSSKDRSSVDLEAGSEMAAYMRKSSLNSQRGRVPAEGIGRSLQRARRRVERRLGRLGLGKGKKKVGGQEEVSGSCK